MDIQVLVNSLAAFFTTYALKVLGAILILIGGWIVSKWMKQTVKRGLERTQLDPTLVKFFSNMSGWLILIVAVVASMEAFGIQTTSIVAVLGAAGLAIGLALQGTLSNFAAGVMLLIFRPFKVGDAVVVAGQTGLINEVDLFTTQMDTFDNRRIIIPNSKIYNDVIETITHHPRRRTEVNVGTDYEADLDAVRTVLERAAASVAEGTEGALTDPGPQVVLQALGGSSIDWQVRVWAETPSFLGVKQALTRAVKKELDAAGIGIPFPQMDVHLDGSLAKNGE